MTTANKITIFRVICIPVFIVLMYMDGAAARYGALAVFVAAPAAAQITGTCQVIDGGYILSC